MSRLAYILQAPELLLMAGAVVAGWYAAYKGLNDIPYAVPVILTAIFVMYVIGRYLGNKKEDVEQTESNRAGNNI